MQTLRKHLEEALVRASHTLHARGWVANHDGNVTARLDAERFLATPTAVSKAAVERSGLVVVDWNGKRVSGRNKPFSEIALHLCVYRQRPDATVVVHAHPPTATGLAVAGVPIRSTMLAEAVVSLGPEIPLVPYARPKTPESTLNLQPHLRTADAWVLERHGVLTCGADLETALLRLELVEHLAKIQLVALQAGGVRTLPAEDVAVLAEQGPARGRHTRPTAASD